MHYKKSSHAVYDCRYHLVWITKFRNDCIDEKMKKRLETVIRGICKKEYVGILYRNQFGFPIFIN